MHDRRFERTEDQTAPASPDASVPGKQTLIEQSVGDGGQNAAGDVRAVQLALARRGHSPGPIDGQVGPRTITAIKTFQHAFLAHPDGLVDVGGVTVERLYDRPRPPPAISIVPRPIERQTTPPPATVTATDDRLAAVRETVLAAVPREMLHNAQTSVPILLRSCRDLGVRDANQVAYILATAQHESGFGATKFARSEPLVEDHNPYKQNPDGTWSATVHLTGKKISAPTRDDLERAYWDSIYGTRLENKPGTDDAASFKGRGYVQLTGRRNYADMSKRLNDAHVTYSIDGATFGGKDNPPIDLVANPTHVNRVPEVAAYILVLGATQGTFTGRALDRYIDQDKVDFRDARSVINGDTAKNGDAIAAIATRIAAPLHTVWPRVFG